MPTKEQVSKLLGRPLTAKEDAAFNEYMRVAIQQLSGILGYSLDLSKSGWDERTFQVSEGYRSLIVDPFTEVDSVSINDKAAKYTVPSSNKPFSIEVVLDEYYKGGTSVTIMAHWGYDCYPSGVMLLLANLFDTVANGTSSAGTSNVKSEEVLSHRVTYETGVTVFDQFAKDNANLIELYRLPYSGLVDAGRILWSNDDDLSDYRPYF